MLSRHLTNLFDMIIRPGGHEVAYTYGYLANAYGISTNEPVNRPLGPEGAKLTEALDSVEELCGVGRLDLPCTLDYLPIVRSALEGAKTYVNLPAKHMHFASAQFGGEAERFDCDAVVRQLGEQRV